MFPLDSFFRNIKPREDDDCVDKLNYYYSCIIIIAFAITISAKQYVGMPIQCWVPAQFTRAWEQYAENYCFVQNTYWVPGHDDIPRQYSDRDGRQIGYYQWVPFIMAMEAIFFYLPCIFWRQMNSQSGIDILSIIRMTNRTDIIREEVRCKVVRTISNLIEDNIKLQKNEICWKTVGNCGKTRGSYVTFVYLFTKLLYLSNVVMQFIIMNRFLGMNTHLWGLRVLVNLIKGRQWEESGHFPRVTLCDFEVRVLGNLHRHTIQCVLMINMFNEKIFLFLWWWFVLVASLTVVSLFYWMLITCTTANRVDFIKRYLCRGIFTGKISENDRRLICKFVDNCLCPDGILMMHLLTRHAGDLITMDIIKQLWDDFQSNDESMSRFDNADGEFKVALIPNKMVSSD